MVFLHKNLFESQGNYNYAVGYWIQYFNNQYKNFQDNLKPVYFRQKFTYDANPIIQVYDIGKTKAVRIIQLDPKEYKEEYANEPNYDLCYWYDTVYLHDREIQELVISLFLTRDTALKAKRLIKDWLLE